MNRVLQNHRKYLFDCLMKRYNKNDLMTMAFILSIDYETIPNSTKQEFVRELILWHERRGILPNLVKEMMKDQPDDTRLKKILSDLESCLPRTKVQVKIYVFSKDTIVDKSKIRRLLAKMMGVDYEEIHIIAQRPGSILLLIGMPENISEKLYNLDLPFKLLEEYEITSIIPFDFLPEHSQIEWRKAVPIMSLLRTLIWKFADLIFGEAGCISH